MPSYLEANRFLYLDTPLGADNLLIAGFRGQEALSQLFSFQLEMIAENATDIDFGGVVGQKVGFGVAGGDTHLPPRDFAGICIEMSEGGRDAIFTRYAMTVAPEVWKLTRNFQSRLFQHMTVPDILKQVFTG